VTTLHTVLHQIHKCLDVICETESDILDSRIMSIFRRKDYFGNEGKLNAVLTKLSELNASLISFNSGGHGIDMVVKDAKDYTHALSRMTAQLIVVNNKLAKKASGQSYSISEYNQDIGYFYQLQSEYLSLGAKLNVDYQLYANEIANLNLPITKHQSRSVQSQPSKPWYASNTQASPPVNQSLPTHSQPSKPLYESNAPTSPKEKAKTKQIIKDIAMLISFLKEKHDAKMPAADIDNILRSALTKAIGKCSDDRLTDVRLSVYAEFNENQLREMRTQTGFDENIKKLIEDYDIPVANFGIKNNVQQFQRSAAPSQVSDFDLDGDTAKIFALIESLANDAKKDIEKHISGLSNAKRWIFCSRSRNLIDTKTNKTYAPGDYLRVRDKENGFTVLGEYWVDEGDVSYRDN